MCLSLLFAVVLYSWEWSEFWEGCGWRRRIGSGVHILFIQFAEGEAGGWKKANVGNIIPHQKLLLLLLRVRSCSKHEITCRSGPTDGANFPAVSTRDLHTHVARVFQKVHAARQGVFLPLTCHEIYEARAQLENFAAALAMIISAVNVLFMSLATRLLLESTLHISGDMIARGPWLKLW